MKPNCRAYKAQPESTGALEPNDPRPVALSSKADRVTQGPDERRPEGQIKQILTT
jgi:hypothetical protein